VKAHRELIVYLESDSADSLFYFADGQTPTFEVLIPDGESDTVFYYRDRNAGKPTLRISTDHLEDEQSETIHKGILTAKADDVVAQFGAVPQKYAGTPVTGAIHGDSFGVTYQCAATNATPVGEYDIGAVLHDPHNRKDNYRFEPIPGKLKIEPASITITADNQTSVYGAALPKFTGSAPPPGVTVSYQCMASPSSDVGDYAINPIVSGAQSNYFVTMQSGVLTIGPAPLGVNAPSFGINLGDPLPAFIGTVTGIQNNDSITASCTCQATSASGPGQYPIVAAADDQGTGKLKNYTVTATNGQLTINALPAQPATPTVTAHVFFKEGVPPAPVAIPNLPLTFEISGNRIPVNPSDANGYVSCPVPAAVSLQQPQLVTIIAPPHDFNGVILQPTAKGPIYTKIGSRQAFQNIELEYEKAPAELWLQANLKGKPLAGVSISLFPTSPPSDKPVRTIVTSASAPSVITGLADGLYNISISPSPLTVHGQVVELDQPSGGLMSAHVAAGQQVQMLDRIQFTPAVGRILATVTDATTGNGLGMVPMTATPHDTRLGKPPVQHTNASGEALFPNLSPGQYTVQFEQLEITLNKTNYVPQGATAQTVTVRPSATTSAPEFHLTPDIPRIVGEILDEDGNPFPNAEVVIYDAFGDKVVDTVIAGPDGKFTRPVPSKGVYHIGPKQDASGATTIKTPVTVNSPGFVTATFRRGGGGGGGVPGGGKTVREAFTDLAAYPVLTEEVGYPPAPLSTPSGGAPSAPGGSGLGQIASRAVADVLGWKVKTDDPKGFVGALTQAFTLTEVEGHIVSKWVPRNYAVQSDLSGGITGAQASLYTRANDALGESLPLLDGLYALDPAAVPEDVDALREVVRDQMTQLVNELGYAGGPRVARVNQYFFLLLGPPLSLSLSSATVPQFDPDKIQGTLGNLRDYYGLATLPKGKPNPLVNTVDDEQNTTNFRVLSDYLTSLAQSWISNLQFFVLQSVNTVTSTPFLGTQLVLISRQLSVTAELVDDVRFALDSVFIGSSERQTLLIVFPPASNFAPIFLEDLLSWIQRLVSEEAPGVIQSSGKFGVFQIVQVAGQLQLMLAGAINPVNTSAIPKGYFTPRVQRAMAALADQLAELINLATPVGTSKLVSVP
jgi:hypothetical protein